MDLTTNYPRKIKFQRFTLGIIGITVLLLVVPGIYNTFGWLGIGCWMGLGYLALLTRKRIDQLQREHAMAILAHVQQQVASLRAALEEQEHEHD